MRRIPAVLFAFVLLASVSHAETIGFPPLSSFTIPDGSVLTSQTYHPPGSTLGGEWDITFSFTGGTGTARGDSNDGYQGTIQFTAPVSDLTLNWRTGFKFHALNYNSCPNFQPPFFMCPFEGTVNFGNLEVTGFTWSSDYAGGIDSMSFAVVQAPELPTFALLPLGLVGLVALRRRHPVLL
jgi:MYXO-CTERM domain-containing protein